MPDIIRVRHDGLHAHLLALRQAESRIRRRLDDLDAEVVLLRGQWSGAASDAYDLAHRKWDLELKRMGDILAEATALADAAAERHRAVEAEVIALW